MMTKATLELNVKQVEYLLQVLNTVGSMKE